MPRAWPPAHLSRPRGRRVAAFAGTIADQAISSLSNVAIALGAARSLTGRQFGAFGVVFALSIVALGVSRALASEPLVVRFSGVIGRPWREAVSASLSAALTLSLVLAAALVAAAATAGPELRGAFLALAAVLPALLVQDALRFTFFAALQPQRAIVCDVVWCTVAAFPAALLLRSGDASAALWLLAWGAGAYAAAGAFLVWLRPRLSLRRGLRWARERASLAGPFVVEFLLVNGAFQIVTLGLAGIAGLMAVAAARGATVVLGPFFVAIYGLAHAAAPQAVGLRRQAPEGFGRFLMLTSAGAAAIGLLGCGALLLPERAGTALLGANWAVTRPVLLPLALSYAATGAGLGALVGLRALGAARVSLATQAVAAPLTMAVGLVGATLGGAAGAFYGVASARALCLPLWWYQLRRTRRAAELAPAARPLALPPASPDGAPAEPVPSLEALPG